ncbi:uncharacterized protein EV422DRAFT_572133 [Fimicolochytrium jonesii]|uniref:uncharacterized protein n=1 Tax=Fimicolochytrium jonesii TaxID=1396493 RepID=UPI0022FF056C|nr:uncharacterized protein EV422DRAFT_572133 [Fimicolochytrium jonesii]KAI8816071.1 hypothetical protein EV422DRAFT_572133 [Fimicolochytrium jonesii]
MNANAAEFNPSGNSSSGALSGGGSSAANSGNWGDKGGGGAGGRRGSAALSASTSGNYADGNARGSASSGFRHIGPGTQARPRKQEQRRQNKKNARNQQQMVPGFLDDYQLDPAFGSPNKRGQISLNHLLGFQLPPRQRPTQSRVVKRKSSAYYEPYNKERFVNANFRFIMDESGDYTVNVFDPDVIVNWESIVQAVVPITKPASCPICLSPPIAPKVTKCGHVYCWHCVTHYLHLGEKKWRKCPICYDAIYAKDLKPARFSYLQEVGKASVSQPAKVEMILMKRALNSTITLPRIAYHTWNQVDGKAPPSIANANAVPYAKLMLSSPEYLQSEILENERRQLKDLLSETIKEEAVAKAMAGSSRTQVEAQGGMGSERPFVEVALKEVKDALDELARKNTLLGSTRKKAGAGPSGDTQVPDLIHAPKVPEPSVPTWTEADLAAQAKRFQEEHKDVDAAFPDDDFAESGDTEEKEPSHAGSSTAQVISDETPSSTESASSPPAASDLLDRKKQTANPSKPPSDGMYYFYQSVDGQHLYLHPLDIKVLKFEYGEYESFPDRLVVDVIKVQESTMNEDLRRRCRYLGHIPLSCDVTFCEIDPTPLVAATTRTAFEKELSQRINKYKAQERKEKQEHDASKRISVPSTSHFNATPPQGDAPYASSWEEDYAAQFPSAQPQPAGDLSTSPTYDLRGDLISGAARTTSAAPSSFARIAATSATSATPWTRRAPKSSRSYNLEDDDDDYLIDDYHGWTLDFEEAVMTDDRPMRGGDLGGMGNGANGVRAPGGGPNANAASGGGGKKGKKKGVTLVTNGGRRGRQ